MRTLALIIILALFIQSPIFAQSCLPDGITFTTQEDIDNFQVNYPGCTVIEGDVMIRGDDISNLNGLSMVTSIGGDFWIGYFLAPNASLTSLNGLENLTSVNGDLNIGYPYFGGNVALTSLSGLDNLTFIGGDLNIVNNPSLTNCEASGICDYLFNPTGTITIYGNAEGCASIIEVAMACGSILPCLEHGDYFFTSQYDVDHFPIVFPACSELEGDVRIAGDDITNLDSLGIITSIGGSLMIGYYASTIGSGYNILGNPSLNNIIGLDNLASIGGNMTIIGNTVLTSLTGLENVTSIDGSFKIEDNDALTSLTGLEGLTSIVGDLGIGRSNDYGGNPALTSLMGLDNVTSIGGSLNIGGNDSLASLTGLGNLISIGGNLSIGWYIDEYGYYGNDTLASLTGLENLSSIGGNLLIVGNESLTSLTELGNVDSIWGNLSIVDNQYLSVCDVEAICSYLNDPNGTIMIYGNAPGCNSQEQVEAACEEFAIDEVQQLEKILIRPNPSSKQITIELPNAPLGNAFLTIYNINSQPILTKRIIDQKTLIDISNLPAGLYFLKVSDERRVSVGKLIKK